MNSQLGNTISISVATVIPCTEWYGHDLLELERGLESAGSDWGFDSAIDLARQARDAWILGGLVLQRIFLYRWWEEAGFDSPKHFCESLMGKSYYRCKNQIQAAEICLELTKLGFSKIPTCQSQAEALNRIASERGIFDPLKDGSVIDEDALKFCWQELLDRAEAEGKKVLTTKFINSVLEPKADKAETATFKFSADIWNSIERAAQRAGQTTKAWIDCTINSALFQDLRTKEMDEDEGKDEGKSESRIEAWQADLKKLTESNPITERCETGGGEIYGQKITSQKYDQYCLFDKAQYENPPVIPQKVSDWKGNGWEGAQSANDLAGMLADGWEQWPVADSPYDGYRYREFTPEQGRKLGTLAQAPPYFCLVFN